MRFRPLLGTVLVSCLLAPLTSCTDSPSLTSIVISPSTFTTTIALTANGQVAPPSQQLWTQYTATGYYTHPNHQPIVKDLTNQVTWLSYTPLLVTVNSSGIATVTGSAIGFSQITASMPGFNGDIISNASTFTVNAPTSTSTSDVVSMTMSPSSPTLSTGIPNLGFAVVGTTGTGETENLTTSSTWTSSTPTVATINSRTGLATITGAGQSAIVATYTNPDGLQVTAETVLTVD
jgi:hypothetical protein